MKSVNKIKVIILKPLGNIPNNNIVKNKNIYNDICKDDVDKKTQLICSNIGSPIYNDILIYCVDVLDYDQDGAFEEDESENIIEYDEDHIINIVYFELKKYCELKNQSQNIIP